MKNINKMLFDSFLEQQLLVRKEFMPNQISFSKKRVSDIKKWFDNHMMSGRSYISYSVRNQKLTKVVVSIPLIRFVEKEIMTPLFKFDDTLSTVLLRKEISNIFHNFPEIDSLIIQAGVHDRKLHSKLKRLNFVLDATQLIGDVDSGLKYLNKKRIESSFIVRPAKYRKDINRIMEIDEVAHRADSSSMVDYSINKDKLLREMRTHYREMCKLNSVFVAVKNNKVIGMIGTYPDKDLALIAGVAVDPKYQGLGVSKHLYKAALTSLKEQKSFYYKGFTTTEKVFGLAKKMKRRKSVFYYKMNRDDFFKINGNKD